jgi:hypothetical protein
LLAGNRSCESGSGMEATDHCKRLAERAIADG